MDLLEKKILAVVTPIVEELSLELVECLVKARRGNVTISILADRPRGGITIDECTAVNKAVCRQLEEDDFIAENYLVEVASPGIDRPLVTHKDFLRVVGYEVRCHLTEKVEEKLEYQGIVAKVTQQNVTLDCKKGPVTIELTKIQKAIQTI